MAQTGSDGTNGLDDLATEAWNEDGADLDLRSTRDLVDLMNAEDARVPAAVARAADAIAAAIDDIAGRLQSGGRLIYAGAGTSGRLAALDAAECESTFSTRPGQVVALIAGGAISSPVAQEAAEDDDAAGQRELELLGVGATDAVVGVSASGRTPYVLGALRAARRAGALTVGVVSVHDSELAGLVEHEIAVVVGPEILAGSTRLKAGTAQKLVLNAFSTAVMVRRGRTYGNLMAGMRVANDKLRGRAVAVCVLATGCTEAEARQALEAAHDDVGQALVMLVGHVDAATARQRLDATQGAIRRAAEKWS
jgi:N-acetylmuramic acid 6-phosphate etherase